MQRRQMERGCRCTASGGRRPGKYGSIGWRTFRNNYHFWLEETGAPMKIQQELMRHASVYGQAMPESKREANGTVVTMVLKPLKASA